MSRLGLSVFEFYKTTPIEFYYALKDNKEWEEGKLNIIVRTIYESMRLQTVFVHNMNPYSKRAIRKPESLLKFEWDKIKQPKIQTLEEMKKALYSIAGRHKKKGKEKK